MPSRGGKYLHLHAICTDRPPERDWTTASAGRIAATAFRVRKETRTVTATSPPRRPAPLRQHAIWTVPALLLLVPLVAMRFTDEVAWTASDVALAAALSFGCVGLCRLLARSPAPRRRRVAAGGLVLLAVLLVWIDGAVGIVGDRPHAATLGVALALLTLAAIAARR